MADTAVSGFNGGTKQTATGLALDDLVPTIDVSNTGGTGGGSGGTPIAITVATLLEAQRRLLSNHSTANQGAGFATDTYLTGSNVSIPSGYPVVGTTYKMIFSVTKTAAGTAGGNLRVRIGTNGTTADASICSFTFGNGTAVVDTAVIETICTFRTVGSGTSAVLQGMARATNLASTGVVGTTKSAANTSSGFDSTTANLIIGASWNGGTSASHTVQLVRAELIL